MLEDSIWNASRLAQKSFDILALYKLDYYCYYYYYKLLVAALSQVSVTMSVHTSIVLDALR